MGAIYYTHFRPRKIPTQFTIPILDTEKYRAQFTIVFLLPV